MKLLLKPFHWLYIIYAVIMFIGIMLLILPFIALASFFGRIRGGNIIYYFLWFWSRTWFPAVGIMVKRIYKYDRRDKQPFIYVVNHTTYLDAALAVGVMRQPFRPLGKIEMQKIPLFGFIYRHAVVPVDRSDAQARSKSVRELIATIKEGVSILLFPEGTTNFTDKPLTTFHNGAFRIAIETQTPLQPVLYLDCKDRLPRSKVQHLNPGRCRIVYLPPVPVEGFTMDELPVLKQQVYEIMEKELLNYR